MREREREKERDKEREKERENEREKERRRRCRRLHRASTMYLVFDRKESRNIIWRALVIYIYIYIEP